jgi:hypothetical protein
VTTAQLERLNKEIAALDEEQRRVILFMGATLIELVSNASANAVDRQLRLHGLIAEARPKASVYFIQAEDGGPIKIGLAGDPTKRLSELQRTSPQRLRILATEPGSASHERELHERFAEHRLHGEWFAPCPELLALIDSSEVSA